MARRWVLFLIVAAAFVKSGFAVADEPFAGLFDVPARKVELQRAEYTEIRAACLAEAIEGRWSRLEPISRLKSTDEYGSDTSAEDFSWAIMVMAGHALAGEEEAGQSLFQLLDKWARADAFRETEEEYDPYYALKRLLLPTIVAYQIIAPDLNAEDSTRLKDWLDRLVRRIDAVFDKEVDRNNHRILADSVLSVWGSIIGDETLIAKGVERFDRVLSEMRPDGTLPLEARRGARALWYQRQTLSSLAVIAEVARGRGDDLYHERNDQGGSFATLVGSLLNGLTSPLLVAVYSAENHIPGPEKNYLELDTSFLDRRGHGRHYMAWAEAARLRGAEMAFHRLDGLFIREIATERPLIDEFAGGNATCFWGRP